MKKKLPIIIGIIGAIILIAGLMIKIWHQPTSISIIGGADGPTSIFLAGKIGTDYSLNAIIIGIIIILFAGIIGWRRKNR